MPLNASATQIAATPYKLLAAATTNATVLKAAPGLLWGVQASSINDAPIFIHFYNLATAPDENSTPVKTLMIPANSTAANGAAYAVAFPSAVAFTTGIAFRIVKGISVTSTSAVDASEVLLNIDYT